LRVRRGGELYGGGEIDGGGGGDGGGERYVTFIARGARCRRGAGVLPILIYEHIGLTAKE
jgi:hypothetical protein